jgi:hypothetical protein
MVVAWLVFPLVPVVLEDLNFQICMVNLNSRAQFGPDPCEWGWGSWLLMLGPLVGYGFLAGATVDLPDDLGPSRRGWRRLAARRSVWVAVGPWWSSLLLVAGFCLYGFLLSQFPPLGKLVLPEPKLREGSWIAIFFPWLSWGLGWTCVALCVVAWSCGWLWPAWATLQRASRVGRPRRAVYWGASVALAFVSSLFGSFWAVTAFWRSYFFDPRVVPLVAVAAGLAVLSGCDSSINRLTNSHK